MLKIKFSTKNDAFAGEQLDRDVEVARILREISHMIVNCSKYEGVVKDINGNSIGEWTLTNR